MLCCRPLAFAWSVSASRQNTTKHGHWKKNGMTTAIAHRPLMSTAHGKSAKYTDDNMKRRRKIKLQKFISEYIYNWLLFLKTFFVFFSFWFFFSADTFMLHRSKAFLFCLLSLRSTCMSSWSSSLSDWSVATAVALPPAAPDKLSCGAFPLRNHQTEQKNVAATCGRDSCVVETGGREPLAVPSLATGCRY